MKRNKVHNRTCSCGSGLKVKHCPCKGRKPRKIEIKFDYGIPTAIDRIRISESGQISLQHDGNPRHPVTASLETTYKRLGKHPKVIHQTLLDPSAPWVNPNRCLKRFDLLLAIDTNTKGSISLTVLVKCWYQEVEEGLLAEWEPIHAIEFHNIVGQAENIGWRTAFECITINPQYETLNSIGVIVDADLGRLPSYNSRALPIEQDYYLPPRSELLYATADTGSEYVANRMLARADQISSSFLQQIVKGSISEDGLRQVNNAPYTHYRLWDLYRSVESNKPNKRLNQTVAVVSNASIIRQGKGAPAG